MLTRREKFRAGLFLAGTLLVFACALALLAGWRPGRDTVPYYVVFPGSISGLDEQSIVKLNGFEIGWIERIELDPACPRRVRVRIGVKPEYAPLPAGIEARKLTSGLTGFSHIDLLPGDAPDLPDRLPPGSTIPGELGPLDAMTRLLRDENIGEIEGILAGINETVAQIRRMLNTNEQALETTIADVSAAARAMKRVADRLERDPSTLVFPKYPTEKQTHHRGR